MRIVVASRNPVKVAATRDAFAALLPLINELYR
jgi:non-canonical (house-cleaning) NTP pyrophosphatase